ncbi:MAG: phosphoenolpyruvate--protein phosphotransferase, partial [Candidatus Methylomirabilis sp.]|nr:phosphoenolpyruvate--protein phosphotransferase [Deltaproteobacteria bacterium]
DLKAMTRDGHAVELAANIETLEETPSLAAHGAEGVGLYRTEFLYVGRASLPTEEEHFEVYSELLRRVYPRTVTIRTLDLGGDKLHPGLGAGLESNPAMGLRAIRLCLRETDMFKAQLRALYRASVHGRLRIMLPMIAGLEEIHRAKALMEEAKASLKAEGRKFDPDVQVGMMVETPAAAILAREFAREVDFFSIGTNDLIQYCLAIDRVNEHVAYLYEPLHPAVLRLLKAIVDAGHEGGIPVAMCGEMAGEPLHALVLLAMGFDVLSMDALSVPRVKKIVRQASMTDAKALLKEVLTLRTATEVNAAVRRRMHQLFPEDF